MHKQRSSNDYQQKAARNMDNDPLASFEEQMRKQREGERPARTHRQQQDEERAKRRLDLFLKVHPFGDDENKWIQKYGNDSHGVMLGELWEWCMKGDNGSSFEQLSMITLETGESSRLSTAIGRRFPKFALKTHGFMELGQHSKAFDAQYRKLAHQCGGSRSDMKPKRPMFWIDTKMLMNVTEPTPYGFRMNALLIVGADAGISMDQM